MKKNLLFLVLIGFAIVGCGASCTTQTVTLSPQDSLAIFKTFMQRDFGINSTDIDTLYNPKLESKDFFATQPIDSETAARCRSYFIQQHPKPGCESCGYDVWVKKKALFGLFKNRTADGFIITPITYYDNITARDGRTIGVKDALGFVITMTKDREAINQLYDFNDPCPNYPRCK